MERNQTLKIALLILFAGLIHTLFSSGEQANAGKERCDASMLAGECTCQFTDDQITDAMVRQYHSMYHCVQTIWIYECIQREATIYETVSFRLRKRDTGQYTFYDKRRSKANDFIFQNFSEEVFTRLKKQGRLEMGGLIYQVSEKPDIDSIDSRVRSQLSQMGKEDMRLLPYWYDPIALLDEDLINRAYIRMKYCKVIDDIYVHPILLTYNVCNQWITTINKRKIPVDKEQFNSIEWNISPEQAGEIVLNHIDKDIYGAVGRLGLSRMKLDASDFIEDWAWYEEDEVTRIMGDLNDRFVEYKYTEYDIDENPPPKYFPYYEFKVYLGPFIDPFSGETEFVIVAVEAENGEVIGYRQHRHGRSYGLYWAAQRREEKGRPKVCDEYYMLSSEKYREIFLENYKQYLKNPEEFTPSEWQTN